MSASQGARRVVVTGLGAISPLGLTQEALWSGLTEGRSGVQAVDWDHPGWPLKFAAPAAEFVSGSVDGFGEVPGEIKRAIKKGLKLMCREIEMGVAAAQRALHDAGWPAARLDPERCGVSFGAGYLITDPDDFINSMRLIRDPQGNPDFPRWGGEGMKQVTPLWLLKYLPNMPACHIAIYNDLRGPSNSITHGEAASNLAVGEAFQIIRRGSADLMVAGSTGTKIHPMRRVHAGLQEELALGDQKPEQASRPFDQARSGGVLGEGAGVVILESLESAQGRGASTYAEVVGAGSSCVLRRDRTADRKQALVNAMQAALRSADLKPSEVSFLHAHGASTVQGDADEAQAIRHVFGDHTDCLPVLASKSNFGNLGAGSGAVELVASLLSLRHGRLFPTLNYTTPDPSCPVTPNLSSSPIPGPTCLTLNANSRGQASCLALRLLG